MNRSILSQRTVGASALAVVASLLAAPAAANVNIPEGAAVPRDSVSVIHVRVLDGCDGEPTEAIEVQIPEAVRNVVPAAVPGWTVEVETVAGDDATSAPAEASPSTTAELVDEDQVALVRWSGGPLPAGQYLDFGLRASFPDEAGMVLAFPVVQRCGLTELRWDGEPDSGNPAPAVSLGEVLGRADLAELQVTVAQSSADLTALSEQLEGVDPSDLQQRMDRVQGRLPELVERMNRLADRIGALEELSPEATQAQAADEEDGAASG